MSKPNARTAFWARMTATAAFSLGIFALGDLPAQAQTYLSDDQPEAQSDDGYHVVTQGDTLWDLSGRYYGDTYEWPRMWSYNAHITNPHWIYPEDIVYLSEHARAEGAAQAGGAQAGDSQISRAGTPASGLYLPVGGYITGDDAQYIGRIRGSKKGATMLAERDSAWVGFGDEAYSEEEKDKLSKEEREKMREAESLQVGDRFSIVREVGTVESEDGEAVATRYLVLGVAQLTNVSEDYYNEVEIVQSWREISRGDMLVPYERQLKIVKQTPASQDSVASIVDTLRPGHLHAEHNYVFIDKGAADGVRVGNRFFAYQRFEGLHNNSVDGTLDEKIPWSRVGQLLVLDVRENFSTAVVIRSERELAIGDRLEMYNGH